MQQIRSGRFGGCKLDYFGTPGFIASFSITIVIMLLLAAGGSRKTGTAEDFSLAGRRSGSWSVAGGIMGTLVGGASTVGTVQLAYLYGLSAWWFTFGSGLACLFLGVTMAPALRQGIVETIPQFISRYHGERARVYASIFSAAGMFIHIVAQLLAGGSLLATLCSTSLLAGTALAFVLTVLFCIGGGMKSAGMLGLVKLLLLYLTMLTAGIIGFTRIGGFAGMAASFPPFPWFSVFGYGISAGLSDLGSMLVGVLSTQTYLQAIFSARDVKAARSGAIISAVMIPPLGLLGIAVGLYMRLHAPGIDSARALPLFISQHLEPVLGGIAFASLLIASVGTAAGLSVGVGTTLMVDIIAKLRSSAERHKLLLLRLLTLAALVAAFGIVLVNLNSAIMSWSFLSMGLRGATLCLPLLLAVFLREGTSRTGGALSIFAAPLAVIIAAVCKSPVSPLYIGLMVSLLSFLTGYLLEKRRAGSTL